MPDLYRRIFYTLLLVGTLIFAAWRGRATERLVALSPTRFLSSSMGVVVEFASDYSNFSIVEGGPPIRLVRVEGPAPMKKAD